MNQQTQDQIRDEALETQRQMFGGITTAELDEYLAGRDTYDLARLAMSMLSDAQETALCGQHEHARQIINRAKAALCIIARTHR